MSKPKLFISHASENSDVAKAVKNWIMDTDVFRGRFETFLSTDQDIPYGEDWYVEIKKQVQSSSVVLVIVTPTAVYKPWVNLEIGGALLLETKVIPCCYHGMKKSKLPTPLGRLQAVDLGNEEDLRGLANQLCKLGEIEPPESPNHKLLQEILPERNTKEEFNQKIGSEEHNADNMVKKPEELMERYKANPGALQGLNLNGLDLSGHEFIYADFSGASFVSTNLQGSELKKSNFINADLRGCDLEDANLHKADFRDADLRDVDLRMANLREADLTGADLRDANLRNARAHKADIEYTRLGGADVTNAILEGANLSNSEISNIKGWEQVRSFDNTIVSDLRGVDSTYATYAREQGALD